MFQASFWRCKILQPSTLELWGDQRCCGCRVMGRASFELMVPVRFSRENGSRNMSDYIAKWARHTIQIYTVSKCDMMWHVLNNRSSVSVSLSLSRWVSCFLPRFRTTSATSVVEPGSDRFCASLVNLGHQQTRQMVTLCFRKTPSFCSLRSLNLRWHYFLV